MLYVQIYNRMLKGMMSKEKALGLDFMFWQSRDIYVFMKHYLMHVTYISMHVV